jgi:hypothetical protein
MSVAWGIYHQQNSRRIGMDRHGTAVTLLALMSHTASQASNNTLSIGILGADHDGVVFIGLQWSNRDPT